MNIGKIGPVQVSANKTNLKQSKSSSKKTKAPDIETDCQGFYKTFLDGPELAPADLNEIKSKLDRGEYEIDYDRLAETLLNLDSLWYE